MRSEDICNGVRRGSGVNEEILRRFFLGCVVKNVVRCEVKIPEAVGPTAWVDQLTVRDAYGVLSTL